MALAAGFSITYNNYSFECIPLSAVCKMPCSPHVVSNLIRYVASLLVVNQVQRISFQGF